MTKINYYLFICCLILSSIALSVNKTLLTPPEVYVHWFQPLNNAQRHTSLPYISGDTFRSVAHIIVDELRIPIDPSNVQNGDIIFLKTEMLDFFFTQVHPQITRHYFLITHNSDFSSPGKYAHMLDDSKLIAWFAVNTDIVYHPKLISIPIGLTNRYLPTGNTSMLDFLIAKLPRIKKNILLCANFLTHTNSERIIIKQLFANKSFCYHPENKPWDHYLHDMAQSKFVLCPHGNGLDCHRTWEALLMGSIPVVKKSSLDSLYEDLPVLIVNEWQEVTEELLTQKYREINQKTYNMEKLYAAYWFEKIKNYRETFLKTNN